MDYRITFKRPWSYRHPTKGRRTITPGTYSVPEQLPLVAAQLAVDQGMAIMIKVQMPTLAPVSDGYKAPLESDTEQKPRRKGRAPNNKSRGRAPEDKSALV